jgi:hypothetical protein
LLLAPAALAADKEAVQRAIDRGVAYLKASQGKDSTWSSSDPNVAGDTTTGATALCGLALLEGGVKADDPAVQKAAKAVREQSPSLTKTYALSLGIMFLDRLGDPADAELIESVAVRLLAGQGARAGGWGYSCPPLGQAEVQRLQGALKQRTELVARPEPPPAPKEGRPSVQDLPKEIQQQLQLLGQQQPANVTGIGGPDGDNSNTQFAVLALWIARRRGIPVETALKRIDTRFRTAQRPDGGWSYTVDRADPDTHWTPELLEQEGLTATPTMTCAGLLGLALSHGSALETTLRAGGARPAASPRVGAPRDISNDPAVKRGLVTLGSFIGKPGQQPGGPPNARAPVHWSGKDGRGYYFLFSLERVAVIYGLETIGDKDWYTWGTDLLVRNQKDDGSWAGAYAQGGSDTCFALLFLCRANLAQDLTAILKGRVQDPGQRQLRATDLGNLDRGGGATRPDRSPPVDAEVGRLSDELVKAGAGEQEQALRKLRDGKGAAYTDALAHAIHRLDGTVREKARDALADRLARMTAATLKDKLRDDDAEVRRAAALACAMKEERAHVPRLIEMLQDPEAGVAPAAHAALKSLAGRDLGPQAAPWKDWWSKNGDR